jgi:hypothetical protein
MQNAEAVLGVLRERGRRGLPLDELYRQLFNPQLYLLAYGRIYSNKGAMTPGVSAETVDGMSLEKIGRIIDAMRYERYRFQPVRRIYIPKKSGKLRPLGLPPWSDKLVGEAARLIHLESAHWGTTGAAMPRAPQQMPSPTGGCGGKRGTGAAPQAAPIIRTLRISRASTPIRHESSRDGP